MGTVVFGVTPRTDTATKTGRCNYSSPAPRERPPLLWVITRGRRRGVRRGCSKRSHFLLSPAILMENYRVLWVFFFHKQPQNWNQELWGPQPRIYVAVCFRGYGWQLVNKPHEKTVTTNNLLFSISVCVRVQSLIYCAVISMCHTAALCNRLLYVHECGHWSLFWVHHTLPTLSARHEFSPQLYKMCINPQMEIVQSKPCGPSLHTLRKISSVLDFSRDLFTVAKLETRLHTCKDSWLYAAQMWRFSSDKVCSVLCIQLSEFSQGHSTNFKHRSICHRYSCRRGRTDVY